MSGVTKAWLIYDWAGNICFKERSFKTFEDAEEFLCETLASKYGDYRQEYFIEERGAV